MEEWKRRSEDPETTYKTLRVPACSQILLFCVLYVHACLNVYVYARDQPERQASGTSHLGLCETEILTGLGLTS